MALPQLTDEQRKEALEKAAKVRAERAQLKKDLASGKVSFKQVLKKSDKGDEIVAKTKIKDIIKSMPGIGKVRTQDIMESIGINENRRVSGLGVCQREMLLDIFEQRAKKNK